MIPAQYNKRQLIKDLQSLDQKFFILNMKSTIFYLLGLLGLELSDVELEFFAFEDVTVASTALAWSGRNSGEEST